MFLLLLLAVLVGAGVHVAIVKDRSMRRVGEIVVVWVLVGYCGIPMVFISAAGLIHPEGLAMHLGFPTGNPFQTFMTVAYLGMAIIAVLAVKLRGVYLVAPVVSWSVFFTGATFIHLHVSNGGGHVGHGVALGILGTHGLIAVILVAGLVMSQAWKQAGAGGVTRV